MSSTDLSAASTPLPRWVSPVRILLGAAFVLNSPVGLLVPLPPGAAPPHAMEIIQAFWATGYLMHTVKLVELVCGLLLVSGRFVPLALVVLAPVLVNITLLDLFHAPLGLALAVPLVTMAIALARAHRDAYAPLFRVR
jgi:hypothetical protein